jgi:hypothetical protein
VTDGPFQAPRKNRNRRKFRNIGVTIPPTRSWFLILAALVGDVAFAAMTYSSWATTSLWIRLIFIWAIVGGALALVYQLAVTQIIAFDSLRLTICKEFNGWERKHEYQVADCSDLEWVGAAKGRPAGLQCKAGWRTVIVGKDPSEEEAAEFSRLCKPAFQASLRNFARIPTARIIS